MERQRKLSKSIGKDTHVRSVEENKFQKQSTQTYEILTGEVFLNLPEPFYRQNAVTVQLSQGGQISPVGMPGGFIDPATGNLHGVYEGLIPGQMVSIGFLEGNSASPVILNRYPYQGKGNSLKEKSFVNPMFLAGYSQNDTLIGNVSGSVIGLYTGINPLGGRLLGSIGIDAFTECNITAQTDILLDALVSAEVKANLVKITGGAQTEISAPLIKIDGTMTEINGNTKPFVTYAELDAALQLYATAVNALFATKLDGGGSPGTAVINISAAQTVTVKTGG